MTDTPHTVEDRLKAQRKALADFGQHALSCDDLDELLQKACSLVSEALDIELVKTLEHLPDRSQMLLRAGVNWDEGVVGSTCLPDHGGSPGGYALQEDEPVISNDVGTEDRFEIPELLLRHGVKSMVNVIITGAERPFGVLEVDSRRPRVFDDEDIAFLRNYANLIAAAVERLRTQGRMQQSARQHRILARELAHRVKNVLSLVQAIASQTSVEGRTARDYRDALISRVHALGQAESVIGDEGEQSVRLGSLAERLLTPYRGDRAKEVTVSGPRVMLNARQARMVGLALHELATNAAKYGVLSVPGGRLRVLWETSGERGAPRVELSWSESGGPAVRPPPGAGFGSRLLEHVVSGELGGQAELRFDPGGVTYRLSFPAPDETGEAG